MKTYLKIILFAIFLGGILAFSFYQDIKKEVIAMTTNEKKVAVFQVGVFKSLDNATNFSKHFSSSDIYQDSDVYRVIIAVTASNQEKLESIYKEQGINYYIKEISVDTEVMEKIAEYDKLITNTENLDVINKLNKSCVEFFLSIKP